MSITTKVRKTGQLFQATNEWEEPDGILGRDAHRLEQGKRYAGHLFDAYVVPGATVIEFSKAEWATFAADELEELNFDSLHVRRRRQTSEGESADPKTHLAGERGLTLCGRSSANFVKEHPTCEACRRLDDERRAKFNQIQPQTDKPWGQNRPQTRRDTSKRHR